MQGADHAASRMDQLYCAVFSVESTPAAGRHGPATWQRATRRDRRAAGKRGASTLALSRLPLASPALLDKTTKTTAYGDASTGMVKAYNDAVAANTGGTAAQLNAVATTAENMRVGKIAMDDAAKVSDVAAAFSTAVTTSVASSDTGGKFNAALDFQIGASTTEKWAWICRAN